MKKLVEVVLVMKEQLRVIVIGAGNRGQTYCRHMVSMDEGTKYKIVGVAEPDDVRRKHVQKIYNIPDENVFTTWEDILDRPKFADVAIVSTMDRMHYGPAMKAIELGYDLLLEKPVSPEPSECADILKAAREKGTKIMVCHVLRYTSAFRALRSIIQSGKLGRVMSVIHTEAVGNIHQSHSFVRGRWGNSTETSPMLLQKSCHDLDIIQWLLNKKCKKIQSFGSLKYFVKENAPEGAPKYCHEGCPAAKDCHYEASNIYYNISPNWLKHAFTKPFDSEEEKRKAFLESQYARCVYQCDNDVVDHQTVNMEFEDGITVVFSMNAFNKGGRSTRVMGTEGELYFEDDLASAKFFNFATRQYEELLTNEASVDASINGGHGGGDTGIVAVLYDYINDRISPEEVSEIGISIENHMLVFAAEESRKTDTVVSIKDYNDRIMGEGFKF